MSSWLAHMDYGSNDTGPSRDQMPQILAGLQTIAIRLTTFKTTSQMSPPNTCGFRTTVHMLSPKYWRDSGGTPLRCKAPEAKKNVRASEFTANPALRSMASANFAPPPSRGAFGEKGRSRSKADSPRTGRIQLQNHFSPKVCCDSRFWVWGLGLREKMVHVCEFTRSLALIVCTALLGELNSLLHTSVSSIPPPDTSKSP